jgi:hypothetical protein
VLIATCAAIVTITMLENHPILAGGLALFFGLFAWIAGHDSIADTAKRSDESADELLRQRYNAGP